VKISTGQRPGDYPYDSYDELHRVLVLLVRSRIDQTLVVQETADPTRAKPGTHDFATSVLARLCRAIETVEDVLELPLFERAALEETIAKRYEDGLDP